MSRFFVRAFSFLAIVIAVVGAFVGFSRPPVHHLRVPVRLVFALPFAAVIGLHRVQRLRGYAYTIAAGSALVVVLTCGLYAALLLVFIGFTMGNKNQLAIALAAPAYVLTQIPLALAALEAWRKACELQDREGCFFSLSKEKDHNMFGYGLSDKSACARGEQVGCKRLALLVAHFAGCSRDARPADCAEIAYLYAHGGNSHRANQIWDAACDKLHKESCLLVKTRDFDYVRIFKLKDGCVTGDDAACAELAKLAEKAVVFQ